MGMSGAKRLMASSNRTWSLPLPVAPWAMASAPSASAISASFLPMTGRAKAVPSRYFSYLASIMTDGTMISSHISSVRSAMMSLLAPVLMAFSSRPSSSSPWPTSAATAMISGSL